MRLYEFNKTVRLVPGAHIIDRAEEPENDGIYDRLHYLTPRELVKQEVLIVEDGKRIVGALGLEKNPYEDNTYWIDYVEVEYDYQNQQIAAKLIHSAFEFAYKRQVGLENSSYTPQGTERIKHIFARISKEFPDVDFQEQRR